MKEIRMYQIEIPVINQFFYLKFWEEQKFIDYIDVISGKEYETVSDQVKNSYGVNISLENSIYVWIDNRENIGTMVHELVHTVWATIKNRGFELEEELFAHIYKYVYEKAEECRKKKVKIWTLEY